jgi:hypothetical protein
MALLDATVVNVITFVVYAGMGVQFFLLVVHLRWSRVPPLSGFTADAYASPVRFAAGFRTAMVSSAALLLVGAVLCVRTIRDDVLRTAP